ALTNPVDNLFSIELPSSVCAHPLQNIPTKLGSFASPLAFFCFALPGLRPGPVCLGPASQLAGANFATAGELNVRGRRLQCLEQPTNQRLAAVQGFCNAASTNSGLNCGFDCLCPVHVVETMPVFLQFGDGLLLICFSGRIK